jgi:hypothetical protein
VKDVIQKLMLRSKMARPSTPRRRKIEKHYKESTILKKLKNKKRWSIVSETYMLGCIYHLAFDLRNLA